MPSDVSFLERSWIDLVSAQGASFRDMRMQILADGLVHTASYSVAGISASAVSALPLAGASTVDHFKDSMNVSSSFDDPRHLGRLFPGAFISKSMAFSQAELEL
jgi:hypothetical protein